MITGDLLVLAKGDIVPADAQVIEAAAFLIDESALTGESVPADKTRSPGRAEWCRRARWWSAAEARPSLPPPARTAQWDGSPR